LSAGTAPDPTGGTYSVPPGPRTIVVFRGATSRGRGRGKEKRGGDGREGVCPLP